MGRYVLRFQEIDETLLARVGGKGAQLGALSRIDGVRVPAGFCVTTEAFDRILADAPSVEERFDRLSRLAPGEGEAIREQSAALRGVIEALAIPDDLATEITGSLEDLGEQDAYAVRSSATAEDLPAASFAGQHDTFLNVVGPAAVLEHVRRCWASLFTERAVAYRLRAGVDHRQVRMAVVVQRMVPARAAGVLFTADPVTGHRKVSKVEAVPGLGEALVSGRVRPDAYTVRDGEVVAEVRQAQPVLTDAEVLGLDDLGRRIEAYFGRPQDIEWCIDDHGFHVVQSRPITTLFPIPVTGDETRHVFVSVGHQQMMTDAMKPLGLSVWQLTAVRPMHEAGGRLFVDVTRELASEASRAGLIAMIGRSEPLIGDALSSIVERPGFLPAPPDEAPPAAPPAGAAPPLETDAGIVEALVAKSEAALAALKREIATRSGAALVDLVLDDIEDLRSTLLDPQNRHAIMAGMTASWWLNEKLEAWLGEKNAADTLSRSAPGNVTSEMGLKLLDVADAIRPHPEVVAFLSRAEDERDDGFLDEMDALAGGPEAREPIRAWLDAYGMRCAGEIDLTRPRWSERPSALLPTLLANVARFEPGEGARRFEAGRQAAETKEEEVLARLRALPDGEQKAEETKRMIDRVRAFIGYREYPKYAIVSRYFVYKQALLEEAERMVEAGLLHETEDVFFLTLLELANAVRWQQVDEALVAERKEAFASYRSLTPPRVLTSDGEVVAGSYRRDDLPPGALVGLPVSAGIVEGRARVVLDMAGANLEPGDILVTAFTDPSWTPAFVAAAGLVTEVGGLMTHGAVIAREYGLPAVVGVVNATRLIEDGQRIRVNGTGGYVEILPGLP